MMTWESLDFHPDTKKSLEFFIHDAADPDTPTFHNVIFSGPIGCGKSTWAKLYVETTLKTAEADPTQYFIINQWTDKSEIKDILKPFLEFRYKAPIKYLFIDDADAISE
jgi:predicted AAA+ superfamily ATPase